MPAYYLVVQDLCRASIGPFADLTSAQKHYEWTQEVGDTADFVEIREGSHDPDADIQLTPEEDLDNPRN